MRRPPQSALRAMTDLFPSPAFALRNRIKKRKKTQGVNGRRARKRKEESGQGKPNAGPSPPTSGCPFKAESEPDGNMRLAPDF